MAVLGDKMKKFLTYMMSVYCSLKNLHYCVDGCNYYQFHMLADRLIKDINPLEVIDHVQEHMIGLGDNFIPFQELVAKEQFCDTTPRAALEQTKTLMQKAARCIETMEFDDKGLESYLTAVEDNLITAIGFLDKSTKKGEC